MTRARRFTKRILIGLSLGALLLAGYILFPWQIPAARSFELISHRGVHQTFPLTDLTNETCTGEIIFPPQNGFIENTIPSMQAAFDHGADAVELDIHHTADDQLIVFHDWTLDCRTDGTGITNQQTVAYLKSLDLGYGYTADGGKTFPLRGKGVGMMPTLPEVLAAFPEGRFVLDDKDGDATTRRLLSFLLGTLPEEQRARLVYAGGVASQSIHEEFPEVQPYIFSRGEARSCLGDYLRMLVSGSLSEGCRQHVIAIPYRMLGSVPGWPHLILARAHQAGARVYVADVDTPEQLAAVAQLPLDGVVTNRIEVIGPLLEERMVGRPGE
jgi:glycerophosphoryl diester phosphodiesterase